MSTRGVVLLLLLLPATVVLSQRDQEKQRDDRYLVVMKRPPYAPKERDYCVEPNTEFDTEVVVSFDGKPDLLGPRDYMDLETSFQEAYNSVRRAFCDDLSRKVVAVSVDDTSIEKTTATEFSLRFAVNVGCDRCGANTDFLFVPKLRRGLTANDGLFEQTNALLDDLDNGYHDPTDWRSLQQSLRGETINRAIITRPLFVNDVVPGGTDPPPPSPAPVVAIVLPKGDDDECCPLSGESRGPTGEEFALEFDNVYNKTKMDSTRKLQGVPIEQVITAFEVSPIDCSDSEEDFDTVVFVELSTSGDPDSVLESEVADLENSFQASYNSFSQGVLCDPFFRTVTSVLIENEEGERSLARSSTRYKYMVNGKCRGCAKQNARLFGEDSGRPPLAFSASRWLYNRELRFMMSDDICFCAVGAEERAVEEEEFTVVYNDNVVRLQREGVLVSIDGVLGTDEDIPSTRSPTTRPTNYPMDAFIPTTSAPTEDFFGEPLAPALSPVDAAIAPTTKDSSETPIPTKGNSPIALTLAPTEAPTPRDTGGAKIPTEDSSPVTAPISSPVVGTPTPINDTGTPTVSPAALPAGSPTAQPTGVPTVSPTPAQDTTKPPAAAVAPVVAPIAIDETLGPVQDTGEIPTKDISPIAAPVTAPVASTPTPTDDTETDVPLTYEPGIFTDGARSSDGLIILSNGLSAKPIAYVGEYVSLADGQVSGERFHKNPDAAAVFKVPGGGWLYISNAENEARGTKWDDGGVGALRFAPSGDVVGYSKIASGTTENCGGGVTPWGSWISGEEIDVEGRTIQVDPFGVEPPRETAMGQLGKYESFAYDDGTEIPTFYTTRDNEDGVITRFTPDEQGYGCYQQSDNYERWCTLDYGTIDYLHVRRDGSFEWITDLDLARSNSEEYHAKTEGILVYDGRLHFTAKQDRLLLIVDLRTMVYQSISTISAGFEEQPDQILRIPGDDSDSIYFAEDGGYHPGLHVRTKSGQFYTVLHADKDEFENVEETTGIAWSPDARHLYIAFQHVGVIYDVTRDDKRSFKDTVLNTKYHAME